jgi:ferredoxin-NADP reductase
MMPYHEELRQIERAVASAAGPCKFRLVVADTLAAAPKDQPATAAAAAAAGGGFINGRVDQEALAKHVADLTERHVQLCGGGSFMAAMPR